MVYINDAREDFGLGSLERSEVPLQSFASRALSENGSGKRTLDLFDSTYGYDQYKMQPVEDDTLLNQPNYSTVVVLSDLTAVHTTAVSKVNFSTRRNSRDLAKRVKTFIKSVLVSLTSV